MSEAKYQSKMANALDELLQQWDERLCHTAGMWGAVWVGIRSEVPSLLQMIDEDPGARREMASFVIDLAKAMEGELDETTETG